MSLVKRTDLLGQPWIEVSISFKNIVSVNGTDDSTLIAKLLYEKKITVAAIIKAYAFGDLNSLDLEHSVFETILFELEELEAVGTASLPVTVRIVNAKVRPVSSSFSTQSITIDSKTSKTKESLWK